MSKGFRRPPASEDEFVKGAATARDLIEAPQQGRVGQSEPAMTPPRPVLPGPDLLAEPPNPRIMKQVNIDMPEPLFLELKALIATIPQMSMRRFILESVREKADRIMRGE